jgi:hypothetical protein
MMTPTEKEILANQERILEAIFKLQVAVTMLGRKTGSFNSDDLWREMYGLEPLRKVTK